MNSMNRQEAKELIRNNPYHHLQPDNSGKGYICPKCQSGTHGKGTGITTKDGVHFTCWAGCFTHADIIDIIGIENNITDFPAKLETASSLYGITINDDAPAKPNPSPMLKYADFSDSFAEWHKHIGETDYLLKRGISAELMDKFNIGYAKSWKNPKATGAPATPRIIIPTSKGSYIARDTRPDAPKAFAKQKVGDVHLFNMDALQGNEPIFITEGEIDALSVMEAGGQAIGLGGVGNEQKLLDAITRKHRFIIMMDGDKAGQATASKLKDNMDAKGILNVSYETPAGSDPNDMLIRDRELFFRLVEGLQMQVKAIIDPNTALATLDYFKTIEQEPETNMYPTGFDTLDAKLDGGLFAGLYIIGAISSLGKTTFTLQMADQIAEQGNDVLFFSLEMSKKELMAKSISRYTYKIMRNAKENGNHIARTTKEIINNRTYKNYTRKEKKVIQDAIGQYSLQASNLYIFEGDYAKGVRMTVEHIETIVAEHIERTGNAPVVFVDYLQILAPTKDRGTDKQNTDDAVNRLKGISREYDIPVFAISSFNRENYMNPVSMTSFKESGAVEYSSDVLMGLQYAGMEYVSGETEKARIDRITRLKKDNEFKSNQGEPVQMELCVLKNRTGRKFTHHFYMVNAFNHFDERMHHDTNVAIASKPKKKL